MKTSRFDIGFQTQQQGGLITLNKPVPKGAPFTVTYTSSFSSGKTTTIAGAVEVVGAAEKPRLTIVNHNDLAAPLGYTTRYVLRATLEEALLSDDEMIRKFGWLYQKLLEPTCLNNPGSG